MTPVPVQEPGRLRLAAAFAPHDGRMIECMSGQSFTRLRIKFISVRQSWPASFASPKSWWRSFIPTSRTSTPW